jgi:hypothetical protein
MGAVKNSNVVLAICLICKTVDIGPHFIRGHFVITGANLSEQERQNVADVVVDVSRLLFPLKRAQVLLMLSCISIDARTT